MSDRLQHAVEFAVKLKERPRSFIYFFECEDFVKIGISRDPVKRRGDAQPNNPFEVKLLGVIETREPAKNERALHNALKAYRARGEWFKLPATLRAWLQINAETLTLQAVLKQAVMGTAN